MNDMIEIQPAPEKRRAFAQWAVEQVPKLRTVSTHAFTVPANAFAEAPEDILIGALVDGRRYVSPVEDAAAGRPAPGADGARLLDCGLCYEEDGQEVHPHPLCPETTALDGQQADADAAAMVAATSDETIAAAMGAVLLATDVAASNAAKADGGLVLDQDLPDVPEADYGPDAVQPPTPEGSELPAPDPTEPHAEVPDGVFPCGLPDCDREFTTERGRDLHRRAKHPEAPDAG
ncbi:hypothetical protein ACGFR8_08010 [Streptomyces brevispora]|uniref:hypothetical protein n=1 Tax=Streptomyces brevispora TaxID=887462 RepID=UPI00371C0C94